MELISVRSSLLGVVLLGSRLCAASPRPIFAHDPKTVQTCVDWWNNAEDEQSCKYVRDLFNITPEQFAKWNPSLSEDCEPWRFPLSYCVSTSDREPPPNQSSTTAEEASSTATTTSVHVATPTAWDPRGCYLDDDPEFPVLELQVTPKDGSSTLTIARCQSLCWDASVNGTVLFAGVKGGNQCWCSSFVGGESTNDQKQCNMPCAGASKEICGGNGYINVFEPVAATTTAQLSATTLESRDTSTTSQISSTRWSNG
ncbi:hypothetical protein CC79DRAFT_1330212 [Sarocladium strictum]